MRDLAACILSLLRPTTWRNPYAGYVSALRTYDLATVAEAPIDLPHDHVWED